jgi:RNA polymerase subunit RPABC4/transcription elongation factor Spt4
VSNGIKLVFQKENQVFALESKDGFNLPSGPVDPEPDQPVKAEDITRAAIGLFEKLTKKSVENCHATPLFRGSDDEYGLSSSYFVEFEFKKLPKGGTWVAPQDIMLGRWGLFARDAFNALKLINRPKLDLTKVYTICRRALDREESTTPAIDMVLDEVNLLLDIGKPWAVEALLREVDVRRLHADVIETLRYSIENEHDLPSKPGFDAAAKAQIAEIDRLRTKIRFGAHEDVRAAAAQYYKKKSEEFGAKLRAGTLTKDFPGMKSVADAQTQFQSNGQFGVVQVKPRPKIPFDQWPEQYKTPPKGPRHDAMPRKIEGDPRIIMEQPRSRVRWEYEGVPYEELSPVGKQFRDAIRDAREAGKPFGETGRTGAQKFLDALHKAADGPVDSKLTFDKASWNCSSCSAVRQKGKFCSECGSQNISATPVCGRCAAEVSTNNKFCPECGFDLRTAN